MEMNIETIYTIVLAALMVIGIVLTFIIRPTTDPTKLHRRVGNALRRYARPRRYRVLDNVTFETKKGPQTVDHILVGYFGLLFVGDLLLDGDYYGALSDEKWIVNKTNRQDDSTTRVGSVENPLISTRACMEAAIDRLARGGVYNLPMEAVAVKAFKKGDFLITGSKDCVFHLRGLNGYFLRSWFEKDTGLDVEKVCALLSQKAGE